MSEGSPHLRALYYPSPLRCGSGLDAKVLAWLLDTAFGLVASGFPPPRPAQNLSPELRAFVRACAREPAGCKDLLDMQNHLEGSAGGEQCTATWHATGRWLEAAVYEAGVFSETPPKRVREAHFGAKNAGSRCLRSELRAAIRAEVAAENEARPGSIGTACRMAKPTRLVKADCADLGFHVRR